MNLCNLCYAWRYGLIIATVPEAAVIVTFFYTDAARILRGAGST